MIPELENTKHDYVILNNTIKNDVYPPDHIFMGQKQFRLKPSIK